MRSSCLALFAVSAMVLSACGGGDGGGSSNSGATTAGGAGKVSAGAYIKDFCTAVSTWSSSVQKLQLPTGTATSGDNPFNEYLSSAVDLTHKMVEDLKSAGTPDIKDGDTIAREILSALEPVETGLAKARDALKADATDAAAASAEARKALTDAVSAASSALGKSSAANNSKELEKAFKDEKACSG